MSDQTTAAATGTAGEPGATGTPAGWYPDPQGAMRWWDGTAWTTHVAAGSGSSVTRTATILSTRAPELSPSSSRLPRLPQLPQLPRLGLPQLGRRTWVIVGAVVAVLALLAGYLLFGRGGSDTDAAAPAPVAQALTPEQIVQRAGLNNADLHGVLVASVPANGNLIKGTTTLDACEYRYTTEAHRVARHEVALLTPDRKTTGATNEVVAYDSVASATQSMAELRTALTRCPRTWVHLDGTGPLVLWSGARVAALPVARSASGAPLFDQGLAVQVAIQSKASKHKEYMVAVVVRRGAVLVLVWGFSSVAPTAALDKAVANLSALTVAKLTALTS